MVEKRLPWDAFCLTPSKKSLEIIGRDERVTSPSYTREHPVVFRKAFGSWLYDVDNKKYLDFAAGIAVMNVGHSNADVIDAIKKQLDFGTHAAFPDFYAEVPVQFIETLLALVPKTFNRAFLSNSGTESVEAAYKLARWHTQKKWAIAFTPSFHGRTMGSLSLTDSKPAHKQRFDPFLPVKHTPYPYVYRHRYADDPKAVADDCLSQLERTIKSCKGDVAAVFFEPISGEGGYIVPPDSFVKGLRKLCYREDILLCADEVQSGCFRTGPFLALDNWKVEADVVSLAKALAGGLPIGATIANKGVMDWKENTHSNTFGGNLLSCAAGTAALTFMKRNKLGENAKKRGAEMMKRLEEMKSEYEILGDVRGKGLMIGLEIIENKKTKKPYKAGVEAILCSAIKEELVLLPCGTSSIRICPPLTLTKEEADDGMNRLERALRAASAERSA